mmetsp:Transcript_3407/g.8789  ORF Transcript_3407/g.8789 Transcript_3407/m.8789 type:complete len:235 (+) Transcript_3407:406-1110(+)
MTARPTMTPERRESGSRCSCRSSMCSRPPLTEKRSSGKSAARRCTSCGRRGGTLRLASGDSPPSTARRACTTKWSTPPRSWTVCTNCASSAYTGSSSNSAAAFLSSVIPMRHLTDTGKPPPLAMAAQQSATSSGCRMSEAPKAPLPATRSLGQPQLRLIASYPHAATFAAASSSFSGSDPPSWKTVGPSVCSLPKNRSSSDSSQCTSVFAVTISVYSVPRLVSRLRRKRMNLSV